MKGIRLYRGDYLPEQRYEDWCIEERERLQVLFLRGAERLALLQIEDGEYEAAIQLSERIIQLDLCWEAAYRLQMFGYYQLNYRGQALKVYEKCRDVLHEELGVEPMPATVQLWEAIKEARVLTIEMFTKL